jgi:hypothetical protein
MRLRAIRAVRALQAASHAARFVVASPLRVSSAAALVATPVLVAGALGYFSTSGTGSATASVGSLGTPSSVVATTSGTSAAVTWSAVTPPGSGSVTYNVARNLTSVSGTAGGTVCSGISGTSCTDPNGGSGLASGDYTYTVTAVWRSWSTATTSNRVATLDHFTISPTSVAETAGIAFSTTVTAIDYDSATMTTYAGTVHFSGGDGSATLPSNYRFTTGVGNDNGVHAFTSGVTLRSAGSGVLVSVNDTVVTGLTGSGTYTVSKASPTLSLSAPASGTAGTAIPASAITATVASSSGSNSSGTITFTYFQQAGTPLTCTSGGTTIGTATVSGNSGYNPNVGFTPTVAGNYWLHASYGGDANNNFAASACPPGSAQEIVVTKASPVLSAAAPASGTAGTAISASAITATLASSSGANSSGTITYTYFQQSSAPSTCTSGGTTIGTASVSGNGSHNPNVGFTPSVAGKYWIYASYAGDANNNPAASACPPGSPQEIVVYAADGSGTMTVSPSLASASQSGRTLSFTYTAATGGMSSGEVDLVVPSGWTAPTASNAAGCTTASTGSLAVSGSGPWTVAVTGVTLTGGSTLTITYGATSGGACTASDTATATATTGTATFTTSQKSTSAGSLTAITSSPTVTVYAADGSGILATTTSSVQASTTGTTIAFTYTAATGGINNGSVRIAVPSGWTVPVTTNAAGCTTASTGTVSTSGQTITVSSLTLSGGSTTVITYGATSGGSCASGDGATATSTLGAQTWQGQESSTAGGSAANLASSPSITITNYLVYSTTGTASTFTSASNNAIVNYPSGTQTNDLLFLVVDNGVQQAAAFSASGNSTGWTQAAAPNTNSPSQFEYQVFYHVVSTGETSVNFKISTSGNGAAVWLVRYRQPSGAPALATAAVQSGTSAAAATFTPGSVTTNAANATAISFAAIRRNNTLSLSTAQSFTFRNAISATPGSASVAFGAADQVVVTSGSTPTSPTWSQTGTAAQWAWITLAFT